MNIGGPPVSCASGELSDPGCSKDEKETSMPEIGSGSADPGTKGDKRVKPGSRAKRPATTKKTTKAASGSSGQGTGTKSDKSV